jgi:hypothetical protein
MAVPVSDRLFRYAFSSPENARDLARNLLICFGRPAGDAALYVYVLVEHKSQPDHWTPFQLLRYMLAVWSDVLRRERPEPQRLPPLLPVVLYQGTREWNAPRTFEALIKSAGAIMIARRTS